MPVTLEQPESLIIAAQDHARTLGIRVTVAVSDEGGLLLALRRMGGALPLSAQISEHQFRSLDKMAVSDLGSGA